MSSGNETGHIDGVSAFIIAGGGSRRFGGDKLLHEFRGKPLIQHSADILKSLFSEVAIIADNGERFGFLNIPWYPDLVKGIGPLAGILTALVKSSHERIFVVGGDMPSISESFVRYLAEVSGGFDVTVPIIDGYYEALYAVYSVNCLDAVRAAVNAGKRQIISFFGDVTVREVSGEEITRFAPPGEMFRNINFKSDIHR